METNTQKTAKQQENILPVELSTDSTAQNEADVKKQSHHQSATYAARLWHSSVKHAHPQTHKGIDL